MDYFYPLNLSKFKLVLSHKKLSILHMAKNEININQGLWFQVKLT